MWLASFATQSFLQALLPSKTRVFTSFALWTEACWRVGWILGLMWLTSFATQSFPQALHYPKQGSYIFRPLDGSLYFCLKIKICAAYFLRHTILSSSTCIIRNRVLTSFVPWTEACITGRLKMRISAAYFLHHTILPQALLLSETGYLHPSSPGRKLVS